MAFLMRDGAIGVFAWAI